MGDMEQFIANCRRIEGRINKFRESIEAAGDSEALWNLKGESARIWIEIGDLNSSAEKMDRTVEIVRLRQKLLRIENLCGALILTLEGDAQDTTVVG
jgi:hypothetical protein